MSGDLYIWRERPVEAIYKWVGNIVCYTIFITVLTGILPAGKYEKYIRLFAGCILILLVFQPLTDSLRLEDQINGLFQSITFENESEELMRGLDGMEEKRMEMLISSYEEEAAGEAARMAQEEGFSVLTASVSVERNQESENFGKIKEIRMELEESVSSGSSPDESGEEKTYIQSGNSEISVTVDEVEKIKIGDIPEETGHEPAEVSAGVANGISAGKLRDRISSYYRVEAENVEIKVEQRSGMAEEK